MSKTNVQIDVAPVLNGYCVVVRFDGKKVLQTQPFRDEVTAWTWAKHLGDLGVSRGLATRVDGQSEDGK